MMLVGRGDKLRCVFDDVSWEGGQVKVRFW